ncbi:MAG: hypothetical protein A3I71_03420 [Omnitrophica WOR_2 bacterium RIFCSPLOWO2_02_FULL_63_16]|nr:MAG: hypothetical protein A2Z92_00200 [Omnitrophica WOR_2 bacterium GWA2_63_20]OGX32336.1 MAG: hypothetical protein A3E56_01975 [Omnitrophica WOR_2 bacterium RIFCSPHIGHO2_12_FULL_64_13]OGX35241.1 MAG: hypothetical protein A3B73_03045 [Omnitrophica WOR_2 bacterium RIFCSPHIGHO2_02_FULL_63_39]OGX45084.1 MAG: hypothetical protein A3I71_03420 [Omnitrophica WOR_2 bacterium RIFCSPLOWO2_02_FULL_63_16]OGX48969.1 MAG: hypothetical protein A3G88_04775 [Omnitrophica WOR_2 bacterium RIFCSPLOWO2_12_FULL_6
MLKATLRSAVLLGLLLASVPSYAEVQNVKVGGDVTVRGFYRRNLDLHDESSGEGQSNAALAARTGAGLAGLDRESFIMSTIGVNIGADLSENVSAIIRLANERNWDSTTGGDTTDLDISQAYLTLKELFYTPLTVRIGTQPIVWGRGFVLGSNLFPSVNNTGDDRNSSISANEFTDFTAFEAIRATLDLSNLGGLSLPLTADYVFIKTDENDVNSADDVNIQGVNLSTKLDAASSEVETYFVNKRDRASGTPVNGSFGSVSTLGVRGSAQPIQGLYTYGELAYQMGKNGTDPEGFEVVGDSHQAWAANLGGDYTFAEVTGSPKLGLEWRYYSGKQMPNGGVAKGGWAAVAPGYFTTALREFQTRNTVVGFYPVDHANITSTGTNQHEVAIYSSFAPLEDLVVSPRLSWFVLDKGTPSEDGAKPKSFLGTEWDTNIVYNYTEDVQLGLLYALFAPGHVFRDPADATAQEVVTTVSVKF